MFKKAFNLCLRIPLFLSIFLILISFQNCTQNSGHQVDSQNDLKAKVFHTTPQVHFVGLQSSVHPVDVILKKSAQPYILVLSSFEAITWNLKIEEGAQLTRILVADFQYDQQSSAVLNSPLVPEILKLDTFPTSAELVLFEQSEIQPSLIKHVRTLASVTEMEMENRKMAFDQVRLHTGISEIKFHLSSTTKQVEVSNNLKVASK